MQLRNGLTKERERDDGDIRDVEIEVEERGGEERRLGLADKGRKW
jgi:hypothetical protein